VAADDDPRSFSVLPDPYVSPDAFGPLRGASQDGIPLWFLFDADYRGPWATDAAEEARLDELSEGTIQIPAITINGETWPAQVLPFTRTAYSQVVPWHC